MLILVLCIAFSAMVACQEETTDTPDDEVVSDVVDNNYAFPETITLEDQELNIFNFDEYYNAIIYTDTDDYGDKISQAVYDRNAYFYGKYKIDVVENAMEFTGREAGFRESTTTLTNLKNAGDDIYDIAYVSINEQYALVTSGVMTDLKSVSTLNLDAEWWDPQLSSSYVLSDGKQYVASSALNLMPYEMTWLVFFNQDMADVRSVPDLFEYVRQGEWTVENMLKVITDCGIITENAEGGYTFDAAGTATYGIAVHHSSPFVLLEGFDVKFIKEQDNAALPYMFTNVKADDFSKSNDWLLRLFDRATGMAIGSDYEADLVNHPEGYVPVFHSNRALFLHAELKSGMTMKKILNSEVYYGMLPQPKLTSDQKNYYTTTSSSLMLLGIPTMSDEKEAVGMAADVLSYLSYRDVLPVYYDDYVSHRNASDKESLEMLNDYIMPGRRLDIGVVYSWTKSFMESYNSLIYSQTASSGESLGNIVTSNMPSINRAIRTFFGG